MGFQTLRGLGLSASVCLIVAFSPLARGSNGGADESRQKATAEFPDLSNPKSVFAKAYAAEEAELRGSQPAFFTNSNWPLMLAYRVATKLGLSDASAETSSSKVQSSNAVNASSAKGTAHPPTGSQSLTPSEIRAIVFARVGQPVESSGYNISEDGSGTAYPKSRRKMRMEAEEYERLHREQAYQAAVDAGPEAEQLFLMREEVERARQASDAAASEAQRARQEAKKARQEADSARRGW